MERWRKLGWMIHACADGLKVFRARCLRGQAVWPSVKRLHRQVHIVLSVSLLRVRMLRKHQICGYMKLQREQQQPPIIINSILSSGARGFPQLLDLESVRIAMKPEQDVQDLSLLWTVVKPQHRKAYPRAGSALDSVWAKTADANDPQRWLELLQRCPLPPAQILVDSCLLQPLEKQVTTLPS